ncbi:glycosyltransferase family 2 protein [soil metagenome]|nr:glycosyltransferase family 2 protein [Gemmatimonadota bacterium]
MPMPERPALSVVVPMYNEEESVRPLVEAVRDALGEGKEWELLLVDDGSRDATVAIVTQIARDDARVRLIPLARNYGQTPAMQAGFDHARGRVVVSMDGDLQNDPRDIPQLVAKLEEGYDLVAGYRLRRQDKVVTRKLPSWIANRLIRGITGVSIRDNGCSLKAYRRELLDRVHLYSDMHRFIPAVAAATAGARITEVPVRHHARQFGASKYGLSRVGKVLLDLLVIKMIRSFRDRPLVMFATGALLSFLVGLAFVFATIVSLVAVAAPAQFGASSSLVLPGAALLWFGLAFYLLMLGLVGEVFLRQSADGNPNLLPLIREEVRG